MLGDFVMGTPSLMTLDAGNSSIRYFDFVSFFLSLTYGFISVIPTFYVAYTLIVNYH